MVSIAEVEDGCAARITRLSGTPYRQGSGPVPTFRRSPIPLTPDVPSSLQQHLMFSVYLVSLSARADGESHPGEFITAEGDVAVRWLMRMRPGEITLDDFELAGLAAVDIAGSMLANWTDEISISPRLIYQPGPIDGEWMTVEQRYGVLFDLSISS